MVLSGVEECRLPLDNGAPSFPGRKSGHNTPCFEVIGGGVHVAVPPFLSWGRAAVVAMVGARVTALLGLCGLAGRGRHYWQRSYGSRRLNGRRQQRTGTAGDAAPPALPLTCQPPAISATLLAATAVWRSLNPAVIDVCLLFNFICKHYNTASSGINHCFSFFAGKPRVVFPVE